MKKIYSLVLAAFCWMTLSSNAIASSFCKPSVLIAAASSYKLDVQSRLQATGLFSSVQVFDAAAGTPTLTFLQTFDVVFVFTDNGAQDTAAFGNVLGAYINGGGGVVNATFDNASVKVGGLFNTAAYRVLVPLSQIQGTVRTLGTILLPSHPMIAGVTSFNNGTASYMSTSVTLTTGAYRVANYDNGNPLICAKENVGTMNMRRADLNFYPPSKGIRSDFWDTASDGDLLMANALRWVCESALSVTANSVCVNWPVMTLTGYPSGGTYLGQGVTGNSFDPATAGVGTHIIYYIHMNASGCADTAMQTIVVNSCQGVEETLSSDLVSIFPNPSSGHFNVSIDYPGLKEVSISVMDIQGKVVYTSSRTATSNAFSKDLSLENLSDGVYSLQVISNLGIATKKIVIQK